MGLSVTYGMVSEMGGEIAVSSQLNRGTRFMVTLPLKSSRMTSPTACAIDPVSNVAAGSPFTEGKTS